jgi:hypothetical protein
VGDSKREKLIAWKNLILHLKIQETSLSLFESIIHLIEKEISLCNFQGKIRDIFFQQFVAILLYSLKRKISTVWKRKF